MQPAAILAVGRALPPNVVEQDTLIETFRRLWAGKHFNLARLEQLQRAVQVGRRHLALPLAEYERLGSFGRRNDAWIEAATTLGVDCVRAALARAGLGPLDVDAILFVSTTGLATPSVDARLANRLGLRPDVKRTPVFGLGCAAGAAGVARAADYLRAFPDQVAVVVSVELCSLTLQREDLSIANVIATGLFGDGAAAVVLGGGARPTCRAPRVLATRSVLYPGTERIMGWDVVDTGFQIVLSAEVPAVVRDHVRADVDAFLASHGRRRAHVRHWICHTGGPRVLEAFAAALELPRAALARSWTSLERIGNVSSASVLFVLVDTLDAGDARPGDLGLLAAMGPGFCSELVLLRW